jgi:hypothetical protein
MYSGLYLKGILHSNFNSYILSIKGKTKIVILEIGTPFEWYHHLLIVSAP